MEDGIVSNPKKHVTLVVVVKEIANDYVNKKELFNENQLEKVIFSKYVLQFNMLYVAANTQKNNIARAKNVIHIDFHAKYIPKDVNTFIPEDNNRGKKTSRIIFKIYI